MSEFFKGINYFLEKNKKELLKNKVNFNNKKYFLIEPKNEYNYNQNYVYEIFDYLHKEDINNLKFGDLFDENKKIFKNFYELLIGFKKNFSKKKYFLLNDDLRLEYVFFTPIQQVNISNNNLEIKCLNIEKTIGNGFKKKYESPVDFIKNNCLSYFKNNLKEQNYDGKKVFLHFLEKKNEVKSLENIFIDFFKKTDLIDKELDIYLNNFDNTGNFMEKKENKYFKIAKKNKIKTKTFFNNSNLKNEIKIILKKEISKRFKENSDNLMYSISIDSINEKIDNLMNIYEFSENKVFIKKEFKKNKEYVDSLREVQKIIDKNQVKIHESSKKNKEKAKEKMKKRSITYSYRNMGNHSYLSNEEYVRYNLVFNEDLTLIGISNNKFNINGSGFNVEKQIQNLFHTL